MLQGKNKTSRYCYNLGQISTIRAMLSQDTALLFVCSCLHKMLLFPCRGVSFIHPSESKHSENHYRCHPAPVIYRPHWDCCRCLRTLHIWLKDCPQREQLYGFSCVWTVRCLFRWLDEMKLLPHSVHR